jgi:phosphatidylglycerol---prolipoprotein diacylglyceryl transferase
MYPTLYHACLDVLGLDVQVLKLMATFGFFIALAFLAAARSLAAELARKHAGGRMAAARRQLIPERPTTTLHVLLSGVAAFIVAFKIFGIVLGKYSLGEASVGRLWGRRQFGPLRTARPRRICYRRET